MPSFSKTPASHKLYVGNLRERFNQSHLIEFLERELRRVCCAPKLHLGQTLIKVDFEGHENFGSESWNFLFVRLR